MDALQTWGYHLICDIKGCDIFAATDPAVITEFVKTLVQEIRMVPYGEPQVVHFAKHDPEKAGWTVIQLIETSSIVGHFLDYNGNCFLDVFSCVEFDPVIIEKLVDKYFNPVYANYRLCLRKA